MSIPLLGEAAVNGHGDTYLEAREALENCKRDLLEMWLQEGCEIPEPQTENFFNDVDVYVKELAVAGA